MKNIECSMKAPRASRQPDFLAALIRTRYLPVDIPTVITSRHFTSYFPGDIECHPHEFEYYLGEVGYNNSNRHRPDKMNAPRKLLDFDSVKRAQAPNAWDFSNRVLYDLCRDHPKHTDLDIIVAKIWLIGRSYAVAIERGRKSNDSNDDFYMKTVAPRIYESEIDQWFQEISDLQLTLESRDELIDVHGKTTKLFKNISDKHNRSLASKYLHFHMPHLFFIYDSRAVKGLSKLSAEAGRAFKSVGRGDNEYRKFAEKCLNLREWIKTNHSVFLSPRQIDNLLLSMKK